LGAVAEKPPLAPAGEVFHQVGLPRPGDFPDVK